MFTPEIRPQIHNLPHAQRNQHAHRPDRKPLDPLIRTLIRIPQLHLPAAQVLHLVRDLLRDLTDASQVRLDGLELLARLDRAPVLGVGADVDVQLDAARRGRGAVRAREDVLEADVEGAVGVGVEGVATFAGDVAWAVVVVADGIFDLRVHEYWLVNLLLKMRWGRLNSWPFREL